MTTINEFMAKLPKLSPAQLQATAQANKANALFVGAVLAEKQRRDKLDLARRSAVQAQPKVVDEVIASMTPRQAPPMPEDTGIARIPAEMNFAEGGIVAFADGGDVERYAPGGLTKAGPEFIRFLQNMGIDYMDFAGMDAAGKAPLLDMFEQTKAAPSAAPTPAATAAQAAQGPSRAFAAGQAARPVLDKAGNLIKGSAIPVIGGGLSAAQGLSEVDAAQAFYNDPNVPTTEKIKQFARTGANVALPYVGGAVGSGMGPLGTVAGAGVGTGLAALIENEGEALKQYRAKNEPSKAPSRADLRSQLNRADAAVYAQPGTGAAPAGGTGVGGTGVTGAGGAGATKVAGAGQGSPSAGTAPSGLRDAKGVAALYSELLKSQKYEDPAKAEVEKLAQEQLAAATRRKQEYDAFVAKQGDVYKDRSDRLVEREKGIGKQVDQNVGLSLLNAGLAIMSTPGSLAKAIGKGAQVGTAQFASGLDKINLARDRLADAKDKLEELRLNRDDLTFKQRSALDAEIDKAQMDARRLSIEGIRTAAGVTEKRAETLLTRALDLEKTRFEQSEQTKRTMATINAGGDKTNLAAEKLVQDRVGEWEKANKLQLATMTPAQRAIELRNRTEQFRNDIYTQLKLTPTMGAGASSGSGFIFRGVEQPTR